MKSAENELTTNYGKKQIKKFFNKLKSGQYNLIKWDIESECMVISPGSSKYEFNTDGDHEIGFYELEENYF